MDWLASYQGLEQRLADHIRANEAEFRDVWERMKGTEMSGVSDKVNINLDGAGGGMAPMLAAMAGGGGFGGNNGIWPLFALAFLARGNNGLFGGGDGGGAGAVTQMQLMDKLGSIQAAIPLAESQTQLALAQAQSDITSQTLQQTIALQGGISQLALQSANQNAMLGDKVDAGFAANNLAIANAQFNLSQAISNDGEKTRALIGSIDRDNLNRQITTLANEVIELRNDGRRRDDTHNITLSQVVNQAQTQSQFQQQGFLLSNLLSGFGQIARATNENVIVGNTGATTTGAQNANPTNVRV